MMSFSDLRDYRAWVGKSAHEVLQAAIGYGGWTAVFSKEQLRRKRLEDLSGAASRFAAGALKGVVAGARFGPGIASASGARSALETLAPTFPTFASRVRNYFNVLPSQMMRAPAEDGKRLAEAANRYSSAWLTAPVAKRALSDHVFIELAPTKGRLWFVMSASGSVYHYETEGHKYVESIKNGGKDPWEMKILKLISPDGAGGSSEVILDVSPHFSKAGTEGVCFMTHSHVRWTPEYVGTYNYAETIRKGFFAHKFMDVDPHKDEFNAIPNYYLSPPDPWADLTRRFFPPPDAVNRLAD